MSDCFDRSNICPAVVWPRTAKFNASPMRATYIVVGVPHGGTTLISGLLRMLGVFMGRQIETYTQEDVLMRSQDLQALIRVVKSRNSEFSRWGWKCPGSIRFLDDLRPYLRNPCLVVVSRDPLAAVSRNVSIEQKDHLDALQDWVSETQWQLGVIERFSAPTLFVSYEISLRKPELLVDELARFVGATNLDASLRKSLVAYVNPMGGYRNSHPLSSCERMPLPRLVMLSGMDEVSASKMKVLDFVRYWGVERDESRWILTSNDPQCFVSDADLAIFPGPSLIRFEVNVRGGFKIEPSFYLDVGHGLGEVDRIKFGLLGSGIWYFRFDFPGSLGALRLDPDEKIGMIDRLCISIAKLGSETLEPTVFR